MGVLQNAIEAGLCTCLSPDELNTLVLKPMCKLMDNPRVNEKALHIVGIACIPLECATLTRMLQANGLGLQQIQHAAQVARKDPQQVVVLYRHLQPQNARPSKLPSPLIKLK